MENDILNNDVGIIEPEIEETGINFDDTQTDDLTDIEEPAEEVKNNNDLIIDDVNYGDIENLLADEYKINDFDSINLANGDTNKFIMIVSLIPYDGKSEVIAKANIPQDDGKIYISVFNNLVDNEIESLADANFETLSDIYFFIDKQVENAEVKDDEQNTDDIASDVDDVVNDDEPVSPDTEGDE